jgi:hypothetical protein
MYIEARVQRISLPDLKISSGAANWRVYAHHCVLLLASETTTFVRCGGQRRGSSPSQPSRRLLREALRPTLPLASGWDLVLIARPALVTATLKDTRAALLNLLRRAKILPADES